MHCTHTHTHTHTHAQSDNELEVDELNQTLPANFKYDHTMSMEHNTTASVGPSTKQKGTSIVRRQPVARDSRPNVLRHKKEDGDNVRLCLPIVCVCAPPPLFCIQMYQWFMVVIYVLCLSTCLPFSTHLSCVALIYLLWSTHSPPPFLAMQDWGGPCVSSSLLYCCSPPFIPPPTPINTFLSTLTLSLAQ